MKLKKYVIYLVVLSFFVNFVGCAGLSQLDPQNLKGNHARARFVNATYNMAFLDYQRYSVLQNLKPEAVTLLKAKRKILINLHLPISLLNNHAESGVITDVMFQALLDKLLDLETGWYTTTTKMQTFALDPKVKDHDLERVATEAGLIDETTSTIKGIGVAPKMDPIVVGVLLELLKVGIHAVRALLSQRNLDDEAMKAAWLASWTHFKTLNPNTLVVLE